MKASTWSSQPDGRAQMTRHGPGTCLSPADILELRPRAGGRTCNGLRQPDPLVFGRESRVRAKIVPTTTANTGVLVPAVEPVARPRKTRDLSRVSVLALQDLAGERHDELPDRYGWVCSCSGQRSRGDLANRFSQADLLLPRRIRGREHPFGDVGDMRRRQVVHGRTGLDAFASNKDAPLKYPRKPLK